MVERTTPGVYVEEIPAFPDKVLEVATAVPAFIGYTQRAQDGAGNLGGKPVRIANIFEYQTFFGGEPGDAFNLDTAGGGWTATASAPRRYLYSALRLFFDNGGGACFIVSVGDYQAPLAKADLLAGLAALDTAAEPSMVVIPDAASLSPDDALAVQQQMLQHCARTKNRVAILDLYGGDRNCKETLPGKDKSALDFFRDGIGDVGLDYGAAYYPWIETSLLGLSDIHVGYLSSAGLNALVARLRSGAGAAKLAQTIENLAPWLAAGTATPPAVALAALDAKSKAQQALAHSALMSASPDYRDAMTALLAQVNKTPPCGAIAGVYARTDLTRGVFKAPAGTGLVSVLRPLVAIADEELQDLNFPLDGKAVNAIREITGEGVMVWGGRTLDGNSQDTRYINVRRTMIMLEQSIKNALQAYMFEPNAPGTWVAVGSTIRNFLLNQWKAGALPGSTPAQAFEVSIGLGATMTAEDVRNGDMKVQVQVALVRPAEFVELTFQQTMSTA